jgi:hypothetical protein
MNLDIGKIDLGIFSSRNRNIPLSWRFKLYFFNGLWSGWGNMAVGDSRGGYYAKLNIVFFIIGVFTFFIPALIFYIYCCHQGYQYLLEFAELDEAYRETATSINPLGL